jgi:uncharacterized protein
MKSCSSCTPCTICSWVLVIGGLNWGLVGAFQYNLVSELFGSVEWLERGIYVVVGIAAIGVLAKLLGWCKNCKACKK